MIWMIFLSLIYRNKVALPFSQKKKKKIGKHNNFFFFEEQTHTEGREKGILT